MSIEVEKSNFTKNKFFLTLFPITFLVRKMLHFVSEGTHQFMGKHFLASYLECDRKALTDIKGMIEAMDLAVVASGATILNQTPHIFSPNGLTIVYLLSESHASLHTYPEHNACFVDIFTCGDHCIPEKFDATLKEYLQPKKISSRFFLRHEEFEELNKPKENNARTVPSPRNFRSTHVKN